MLPRALEIRRGQTFRRSDARLPVARNPVTRSDGGSFTVQKSTGIYCEVIAFSFA